MKKSESTLVFWDVATNLSYVKVVWNRKVVFDNKVEEDYKTFENKYGLKKIYSMKMKVVESNHCILYIRGEK